VTGPRHVGAKRNLGVERARYDPILFTDSDCRVSPDVSERHIKTLRGADSFVTAGRRLYGYGRSEQWMCSVPPRYRRPVLNAFTVGTAVNVLRSKGWSVQK
jgi:Glycosyl transferase family 2